MEFSRVGWALSGGSLIDRSGPTRYSPLQCFKNQAAADLRVGRTSCGGLNSESAHAMYVFSWIFQVFAWDGVLPAFVWLSPILIGAIVPGNRGAIEATAIVIPIIAFLIRFRTGRNRILTNHCGNRTRMLQVGVFSCGIFLLVLIDGILILSHLMPAGALFANPADRQVWTVLFAIYLTSMLVAMYPGQPNSEVCSPPDAVQ